MPHLQKYLSIQITMKMRYFLILNLLAVVVFAERIYIGAIITDESSKQSALEISIEEINQLSSEKYGLIFAKLLKDNLNKSYDILEIDKKVCRFFEKRIAAVISNLDDISLLHVQSICDTLEIPLLISQWESYIEHEKSINLYPYAHGLAQIYDLFIKEMEWKSYALLYDGTKSLVKFKSALKKFNTIQQAVRFYRIHGNEDDRNELKRLKQSGETNIVINCSWKVLENILHRSLQVGMISDKFNFFITCLDFHTIDFSLYQYTGVNLTGIRLTSSEIIQDGSKIFSNSSMKNFEKLKTEEALLYDAVKIFEEGFQRIRNAAKITTKKLLCDYFENWEHGMSLSNFIKSIEIQGLTGLISFDNYGYRSNFKMEVFKLADKGINKIGDWNSTKAIEWYSYPTAGGNDNTMSLRNTTFKVLIALTKPYGMLKETVFKMSGNDQYEGFAIDIIYEISKMLGFNYTFCVQSDNVYGSLNPDTGSWNGMLRKIIDNEADLAITDLTITAERETAVDFTMPFMNLGISILYQKPKAAPPSLMSFLLPFSTDVWLYLMGVYVIISILFFAIGRMCPAEWNNIYPCIEEPDELENQFTIRNSLWFCMGAIMQQGSEIAPIGNCTRMLAGCWWFFCLIIVSSYTANLAAFLTVETVEKPIKNADDLANQNVIQYGAKKGGSTLGFFKDSNSSTYSKMYQYMQNNAEFVLTSDNDEGKKKVLNQNYAFLMESSSIEYIQERECNLTQIGGLLDQKGYGIAMRKNATFRNELSGAVLKLQEMGILTALKNKWWKEKGGGGRCQEETGGGQAEELGLANVGGVFLVLVLGVAISFIITIYEFIYNSIKTNEGNINPWNKIKQELSFVFMFGVSTKPIETKEN